jgi:hypothetical protein
MLDAIIKISVFSDLWRPNLIEDVPFIVSLRMVTLKGYSGGHRLSMG